LDVRGKARQLICPDNAYVLTTTDPSYSAADEDLHILFRPLFWTSFLLADQIVDQDFHGAAQIVFSSASSKTAYGTAAMLQGQGRDIVGLTSARNVEFTDGLGCYDVVMSSDDIDQFHRFGRGSMSWWARARARSRPRRLDVLDGTASPRTGHVLVP
jgi:hypothetical protein